MVTTALSVVFALASVPTTFLLAKLFWQQFRETRGIALLLGGDAHFLGRIVTADLIASPPPEVARFSPPGSKPATMIAAFQQADDQAHAKARGLVRWLLAISVLGSGVAGWRGFGWIGLVLLPVNFLITASVFVKSTEGAIDDASRECAIQHVQILAVLLHRWLSESPQEARAWLEDDPTMKQLGAATEKLMR